MPRPATIDVSIHFGDVSIHVAVVVVVLFFLFFGAMLMSLLGIVHFLLHLLIMQLLFDHSILHTDTHQDVN
jgi:hypothetical protein